MKKISLKRTFALATSAIALTTAFVGCSDYTGVFSEEEINLISFNKQYDEEFIKLFGTPNPNQDWGLTVLEPIVTSGSNMRTRASGYTEGNGTVLVNRNQWIERNASPGDGYHNAAYKDDALAHNIQIPGWPHLNGLYYGSNGGGALEDALKPEELDKKGNSWQPVGDVTEYEIQYVTAWFRTHEILNPQDYREDLHLSDFFIQNISQDEDQTSYGDINYDNISVDIWDSKTPGGKTDQEIATHNEAVFATRTNGTNIGNLPNASTYTNSHITRKENSSEKINYKLDDLGFQDMSGKWTHVNNFNNQNANQNPEESGINIQREIKYVKSSGTENFHCHPSWNTKPETNYIDSWVLVHLTWVETVKDPSSPLVGQAIPREGYYLAFDFHAGKDETQVTQDHYYSNWIVKITPGHFNPETTKAKRVMCEDLGGSYDFDFNDVVYDVAFENYNGTNQAIITLQAAGGTMPIMVGVDPTGKTNGVSNENLYEAHKLMGDGELNPINVSEGSNREVAIYRVNANSTDLNDIKFYVKNTKNGGGTWKEYSGNARNWMNLDNGSDNSYGTPNMEGIKNPDGQDTKLKAPRAFAVPLKASIEIQYEEGQIVNPRSLETKWMKEYQCIHDTYYEFDDWAKSSEKGDTGFGMDGARGWWEQTHTNEKLYIKGITAEGDNPTGEGAGAPATWIPLYPNPQSTFAAHGNKCFSDYYLDITGYTGTDAISNEIIKPSVKQVTFTIVFESATRQDIEAILIPADVATSEANGVVTKTTMSYQGNEFASYGPSDSYTKVTDVFKRWQTAVESENRYVSGKYSYVCRFTFTKEQLLNTTTVPNTITKNDLSHYLFLYVKSESPVQIPAHPSTANKWQWYIHY